MTDVPNILELSMLELRGSDFVPGALVSAVPELLLLQGTLECNTWHNNETTWTHTWQVFENVRWLLVQPGLSGMSESFDLDAIDGRTLAELFAWANVLHDVAKPATQDIHLHEGARRSLYPGHEAAGAEMARTILARLGFTSAQVEWVAYIVRWHGDMHAFFGKPAAEFEVRRADWQAAHPHHWRELFLHSWADTMGGYLEHTNKAEYDLRLERYAQILCDSKSTI